MIVTMKKYILAMLLGCLFMASCNETDCSYLGDFKLVQSTTNYSANACTGYIMFDAGSNESGVGVTATSSEEWCKVSVDASKVYISLDDNISIDSRTAMVTITNGSQTKRVPVTQLGCVTEFGEETSYLSANKAMSIDYVARNTFGLEVTGLPEWVSYTISENGIHFDVEANKTGAPRKASAVIKALKVDKTQTVDFVQFSSDDLFGDWIAEYDDPLNEQKGLKANVKVELDKSDSTVTITGFKTAVGTYPLVGKLTKDGGYEILGLQLIGNYAGVYKIVQVPVISTLGFASNLSSTMKCNFTFEGTTPCCKFVDKSGAKVVGYEIAALDDNNDLYYLASITNLVLHK